MMRSFILSFIILTLFFGCSATNILEPQAAPVRVHLDTSELKQCRYLGEIISSEGVWYNFLFISNHDLTKGSRDDLRNKAYALGGNAVVIENHAFVYTTSTVYVGNVYDCPDTADKH